MARTTLWLGLAAAVTVLGALLASQPAPESGAEVAPDPPRAPPAPPAPRRDGTPPSAPPEPASPTPQVPVRSQPYDPATDPSAVVDALRLENEDLRRTVEEQRQRAEAAQDELEEFKRLRNLGIRAELFKIEEFRRLGPVDRNGVEKVALMLGEIPDAKLFPGLVAAWRHKKAADDRYTRRWSEVMAHGPGVPLEILMRLGVEEDDVLRDYRDELAAVIGRDKANKVLWGHDPPPW